MPPGWRFDVQAMAFVPLADQGEFVGLDPEFAASHESVFCGAPAGEMNDTESLPGGAGQRGITLHLLLYPRSFKSKRSSKMPQITGTINAEGQLILSAVGAKFALIRQWSRHPSTSSQWALLQWTRQQWALATSGSTLRHCGKKTQSGAAWEAMLRQPRRPRHQA